MLEHYLQMFAKLLTNRGRDRYPEITYHRAPDLGRDTIRPFTFSDLSRINGYPVQPMSKGDRKTMMIGAWDMGYNSVTWSAPALIVASAPQEATTGMVDVSLALCYLELAAQNLGLGTCWAGVLEGGLQGSAEVRESVGLPNGHPYHYPMMVGYPKRKYSRLPERKTPKIIWK